MELNKDALLNTYAKLAKEKWIIENDLVKYADDLTYHQERVAKTIEKTQLKALELEGVEATLALLSEKLDPQLVEAMLAKQNLGAYSPSSVSYTGPILPGMQNYVKSVQAEIPVSNKKEK